MEREMQINDVRWLDIRKRHVEKILDLPWLHRDPFDRLLVAQGLCEDCRVVTADAWIPRYGVPTIWQPRGILILLTSTNNPSVLDNAPVREIAVYVGVDADVVACGQA